MVDYGEQNRCLGAYLTRLISGPCVLPLSGYKVAVHSCVRHSLVYRYSTNRHPVPVNGELSGKRLAEMAASVALGAGDVSLSVVARRFFRSHACSLLVRRGSRCKRAAHSLEGHPVTATCAPQKHGLNGPGPGRREVDITGSGVQNQ